MLEGHRIEKLHHDEGLAFTLADFVDGTDVGMIQGRRGTSLPAETFERMRVSGNIFRQELQGDEATKLRVPGLVNHAHAATAELFNNAVVRDGLADHAAGMLWVLSGQVNEAQGAKFQFSLPADGTHLEIGHPA